MTAFAAHLPDPVTPAGPVSLGDPALANPLLVHMHALLTVCGTQVPATGDAIRERILDAVLGRERDRWAATFPAGVPTGGARTRQQAVTVATLLAPPTETTAGHAMTVIGEFAPDAAAGARAAVATWLRELYPGSDPPWIAPLRPDLLAEQLLSSCPQLSDLVLGRYAITTTLEQVEQLLTELTRADVRAPVREALDRLLAAHLPDLFTAAIEAPASRLPDLLDLALVHCPQPGAAVTLGPASRPQHWPGRTRRHLEKPEGGPLPADARRPDGRRRRLAAALNNLADRLGDLDRREDALAAIEEAVTRYRQLTAAQPDVFTPDLAAALNNLANRLGDLDRREDALAAIQEAVSRYRQLDAAQPDVFTPDLAAALNNLANRLGDLDRWHDALATIQEAVDLRRQLADALPDEFTPDLATSLNNLWGALAELGRREDALAAIGEAVALRRRLAMAQPDAFTPVLATSLSNLVDALAILDRPRDALAAAEEAVTLPAAGRGPARRVHSLPGHVAERPLPVPGGSGRPGEALAAVEEAVTLYRQLAATRPGMFTPDLAMSAQQPGRPVDRSGPVGGGTGRDRGGGDPIPAASRRPARRVQPDLTKALRNLAHPLAALGRPEDALAAEREAAALHG